MKRLALILGLAALSTACPSEQPGNLATVGLTTVLHAQATRPDVVNRLAGAWSGTGTVLGRASTITMTWEAVLGEAFVRLRFRNEMAAAGTEPATVLEAHGYYRFGAGPMNGRGTWIDSRGVILPLTITVGSDHLTSDWGDETTEVGRTTYRLAGPDTLEVVDSVRAADGQYREFGRTTLTRR